MMNRRILSVFLFLISLGNLAQAATLSLFADNKIQINGNTAINITANVQNQVWVINTVSDCYINTWGGTATVANSRKLLANSVYPVQMLSSKISILGTATENIIITQAYPGVLNTVAIKKKISSSEVSTALTGNPLGVTYGGTGTSTVFTQGSILFIGVSGVYSQKNSNLFWDNTNNRLGIGKTNPASALDVNGTITATGVSVGGLTASQVVVTDGSKNLSSIAYSSSTSASSIVQRDSNGGVTAQSFYSPFTNLTDAATIAINFAASNHFNLTIGGNRTLGVPSNMSAGQSGVISVRQDSVGGRTLAYSWPFVFSGGVAPTLSTGKFVLDQLNYVVNSYNSGTATITIATPGVVTRTAHGLVSGQRIQFTTTGTLPTGIVANTTYWINVIDANTFNLATSLANLQAGTFVATSGTQSGTHTATNASITLTINPGIN